MQTEQICLRNGANCGRPPGLSESVGTESSTAEALASIGLVLLPAELSRSWAVTIGDRW